MKTISHTTKDGLEIVVIDDLFEFNIRSIWMNTLFNAQYHFSVSYDSQVTDFKSTSSLGSLWDYDSWDDFGLNRHPNWNQVQQYLGNRTLQRAWLNLHSGKELYRYHSDHKHTNAKSILFYPNLKWESEWDGQTIFKSSDLTEVEYCAEYVPGRIIIFDSCIPHKAIHPNHEAPNFRTIINAVFY
tara:strand:- start:50 stop:604 length:555 start_codon:yes stop_codon:yes gene_type:complete